MENVKFVFIPVYYNLHDCDMTCSEIVQLRYVENSILLIKSRNYKEYARQIKYEYYNKVSQHAIIILT